MLRIAVVILNYNGENLLRQFLPSVIRHSGSASLYVADNGSTDSSVRLLETEFPDLQIIRLPANYGFCKGYNEALRQVQADVYILLNSDIEVTAGWLDPIQACFTRDSRIAAVQPRICAFSHKNMFEYAGAGGGLIDSLGYPFCRGRIFDTVEEDRGQYNDEREIFWASGACLAIRSEVYHRLGGLDEDFFAHMEEIDLCWRIQRAGQSIYYTGQSVVYHLGAGTLGYANPKKTWLNFRNNLLMLYKHYAFWELVVKLPLRILLDWAAALYFSVTGCFANTVAIFRAHLAFIRMTVSYRKKRNAIQKAWPSYPKRQIYRGLILVDYYVKRRKVYRNQ